MRVLFATYCPWGRGAQVGNHHYARLFQEDGNQVCWLSHPLNLYRFIRRSDDDCNFIKAWRRGLVRDGGISSLTPLALMPYLNAPLLRGAWLGRRYLQWTVPSVAGTLKRTGFDSPDLVWFGRPRMLSLLKCLTDRHLIVYRMADLNTGFQGCPASMMELEAELCRRSAVVFATARVLVERARQWTDRVIYLPNGVEIERFQNGKEPEPDDLADIPHPRLIFIGTISDWFDLDMIEHLARARPQLHIILIGPIISIGRTLQALGRRITALNRVPNFHYLGFRHPAMMPKYLAHSDVGLIPFQAKPLTHSASPIKLFEYAAAGLPVVSRNLTETRSRGGATLFYETPSECLEMVDEAISRRVLLGERMRSFARENTWASRYRTVRRALAEHGLKEEER